MNNLQITNDIMRRHKGIPLLDSIQILPSVRDKAIFIETGLWSPCTHKLLHELNKQGIVIDFRYPLNVLQAIKDGYILFQSLDKSNQEKVIQMIGTVERIPYTMKNFVARNLLWEIQYMQLVNQTKIFRGFDEIEEGAIERGNELHPTLHWSKVDVVKYMQEKNIELTGNEFHSQGFNEDKIKDMIEEAIANSKRTDDIWKIRENLKSWGYLE